MRTIAALLLTAALVACHEEVDCPPGRTECGGRCVSLLTDPQHCGACGVAAGPLQTCSAGALVCAAGVATCGGACTDLARDPASCGACGQACEGETPLCTSDGGTTACTASCPGGFAACAGACVRLEADRFHCGACGNACAEGETCRGGACSADLHVACLATSEVVPVTADLAPAGAPRSTPTGPSAIALLGDAVYAANGFPQASVSVLPLDASAPPRHVAVAGIDLQAIVAHANVLLVSNAASGTLLVVGASGELLDEIPLPDQQSGPNPHGIAVAGSTAYVALYGNGPGSGQEIATVDLSPLAACSAPDPAAPACGAGGACAAGRGCVEGTCRLRCGTVTGTIDLMAVPGSHDAPGLPLPDSALLAGGRVYVSLANLADDPADAFAFYSKPAGTGKIAVLDPASDAVRILDLGAACGKAGAMALHGTTLWVACGSFSFRELAPGLLLPIELASGTPVIGTAVDVPGMVPGRLAFCGGAGYVGDLATGDVLRFDPETRTAEPPVQVCAVGQFGFASVSDLACAR